MLPPTKLTSLRTVLGESLQARRSADLNLIGHGPAAVLGRDRDGDCGLGTQFDLAPILRVSIRIGWFDYHIRGFLRSLPLNSSNSCIVVGRGDVVE